jgi:hypothetical protein
VTMVTKYQVMNKEGSLLSGKLSFIFMELFTRRARYGCKKYNVMIDNLFLNYLFFLYIFLM